MRLIQVGIADGSQVPRLVCTKFLTTSSARYSALSHCWGSSNMSLKTTRESLETHLTGFNERDLPKTFMDAILICRKLGIPYLWIDSLCIIQDDAEDWQRESAKMASIYRNAYLTIAAADSKDSSGGCFPQPLKPSLHFQIRQPKTSHVLCKAFVRFPCGRGSFNGDFLGSSILSSRGWILQELVLSRRIVYFTKDQLYWQCNSCYTSEDGTANITRREALRWEREEHVGKSRLLESLKLGRFGNAIFAFKTWWCWVMDFNKRQLTYTSDKLPALAGLTRYYQGQTGDKPLVGLWRCNIFNHLLWEVAESTRESGSAKTCTARRDIPSWSWASIDGEVSPFYHESLHYGSRNFGIPRCSKKTTPLWKRKVHPELVSTRVVWSGEPLTSVIVEARLQIRGRVLPKILKEGLLCSPEGRPWATASEDFVDESLESHQVGLLDHTLEEEWFFSSGYNANFRPNFDVENTFPDETKFLCLYMTSVDQALDICLVLRPVENMEGYYRRVGTAHHFQASPTWYGHVEERIIYLM